MHTVTKAYLECALWADAPRDEHDVLLAHKGWSAEALVQADKECATFCGVVLAATLSHSIIAGTRFGHDFWLTRVGHGAGFDDGDWPESVGERLAALARAQGERDVYVGDDGYLYFSPGA